MVEYREIPNFEGYKVGDDGTVWCCNKRGFGFGTKGEWKQLSTKIGECRCTVSLCINAVKITKSVDELVLGLFINKPSDDLKCLHIDCDLSNNKLSNLEWREYEYILKYYHDNALLPELIGEDGIIYKDVPGFRGYKAGSDGTIWSCKNKNMASVNKKWRKLKPSLYKRPGRFFIDLYVNGKSHIRTVHSIIMLAFNGPRPDGKECRHLNGIRTDNRIENLAYGTHIENEADKLLHGTRMRGEKSPMSKLKEYEVLEIRRLYANYEMRVVDIAKKFNISKTTTQRIINKQIWNWLKEKECQD